MGNSLSACVTVCPAPVKELIRHAAAATETCPPASDSFHQAMGPVAARQPFDKMGNGFNRAGSGVLVVGPGPPLSNDRMSQQAEMDFFDSFSKQFPAEEFLSSCNGASLTETDLQPRGGPYPPTHYMTADRNAVRHPQMYEGLSHTQLMSSARPQVRGPPPPPPSYSACGCGVPNPMAAYMT
mmetsp:Transcript_137417/g.310168  ORF Transcript_137417/g.310168 Transcript_137417/m.310168 type:complete len:182 (+) Transcript_137417:56-601(+)